MTPILYFSTWPKICSDREKWSISYMMFSISLRYDVAKSFINFILPILIYNNPSLEAVL